MKLRALYGHGFCSDRDSSKAVAIDHWLRERDIECERLDLRRQPGDPSRQMRLSEMVRIVRSKVVGPTLLLGSSLGGITMFRAAEGLSEVVAFGLAPAFRIASNWRSRLTDDEWTAWKTTGVREYTDFSTGGVLSLDIEFLEDAERADPGLPTLATPSFIVHGVNDDVVPVGLSREFLASSPACTLCEVDDDHRLSESMPAILSMLERAIDTFR